MKVRGIILIFIFAAAVIFAFLTVRFTNNNLERTFRESSESTYYLLSFIVDHFLHYEKGVETTYIAQLRKTVTRAENNTDRLLATEREKNIAGVWIISRAGVSGVTGHRDYEKEILSFYRNNLEGKNAHTLILLGGAPFFLVNTLIPSAEVLVLSDASDAYGMKIERVLDALVGSSSLRYFAVIDEEGTPVLFSTVYENFLPVKGQGRHVISTPGGNILQIEESIAGSRVVAGFEMESLARVKRTNNIILMAAVAAFLVLECILFVTFLRFERFRFVKQKEVSQLKEISAISTGFAHEFRNSLHTLSLLANDLDKEHGSMILDETARMTTIMDSLRLLGMTDIKREEIVLSDVVNESVSLLNHLVAESGARIKTDMDPGLTGHGNRALLVTALTNMIKNSLEAGARNIEVLATKKGREIQIHCIDDGRGIDKSLLDKIFDPFFSKKGQSGIGLYLTRRIAELHGGRVEVQSDGQTRITITVPA